MIAWMVIGAANRPLFHGSVAERVEHPLSSFALGGSIPDEDQTFALSRPESEFLAKLTMFRLSGVLYVPILQVSEKIVSSPSGVKKRVNGWALLQRRGAKSAKFCLFPSMGRASE